MADFDLDQFCPEYRQAFGDVLIKEKFSNGNIEKSQLLIKFCNKYWLLPRIWWEFSEVPHFKANGLRAKRIRYAVNSTEKENTAKILRYYFLQFHGPNCMEKHLKWKPEIRLEFLQTSSNYEKTLKKVEEALYFPHENMEKLYDQYQKFGAQPVAEEKIKKIKKSFELYQEFKAAGDDDEKWFECIKKLDKKEYIIANYELRLGTNKEIWNNYLKFLEDENDLEAMLDLYLRYCRFFLSDKKMRKEYRKEIERIGKLRDVQVYWIDTIEWELDFGDFATARDLFVNAGISNKSTASKLKTREDFQNKLEEYRKKGTKKTAIKRRLAETWSNKEETTAKRPRVYYEKPKSYPALSIPSFVATYIAQNASGSILSKLHQSCKYFFPKISIPVCHRLVIRNSVQSRFVQQSLFVSNSEMKFLGDQKLILSNSLAICSANDSKSKISTLIQRLYKCEAAHICICCETVTFEQLKFLVSSGKVKTFEYYSSKFLDVNGVPLEHDQLKALIESFENKLEYLKVGNSGCTFHHRIYY